MPTTPVAALFVSRRSIYKHMDGVDAYDKTRDARANFIDQRPVVAHPPCRPWCRLRHMAVDHENSLERERALGEWAVGIVQKNGGVLEQPAGSLLWEACQLPSVEDHSDPFCYTLYIEQAWFGYPTPKPTWLLVCGVPRANVPGIPFQFMQKARVSFCSLNTSQRSHTVKPFAEWLCQVARSTWWQHR